MNHKCTLSELEKKKLDIEKKKWLITGPKKKEEKIADPQNYFFDKVLFKIKRKGQMKLL